MNIIASCITNNAIIFFACFGVFTLVSDNLINFMLKIEKMRKYNNKFSDNEIDDTDNEIDEIYDTDNEIDEIDEIDDTDNEIDEIDSNDGSVIMINENKIENNDDLLKKRKRYDIT